MIEIKSLETIASERITEAFMDAFADYAVSFGREQIEAMLKRRGFKPEYSFGAFDGDRIVAFILNGIGFHDGHLTAYDTGTAAVKSYRGKGLVRQIFDKTQQYLVERGVENYLLEVLSDNTAAIKLYSRLGFETVREFTCHVQACSAISRNLKMCRIDHVELERLDGNKQIYKDLIPDFTPSWQNSQESISRAGDAISVVAAKHNGELCGFIAYDPQQGDLTQIVVRQDYRGEGIGSLLFDYFLAHNKADIVKALNVDVNCESLRYFLESKNLNISSRQFEMIKKL